MEQQEFNFPPVVCRIVASYLTMEEFSKMFRTASFMYKTLIGSETSSFFLKSFICQHLDLPLTKT